MDILAVRRATEFAIDFALNHVSESPHAAAVPLAVV
jgi:hypothetical protein